MGFAAAPLHAAVMERAVRQLARELTPPASGTSTVVAVLPFCTLDGETSEFGKYLAESVATAIHAGRGAQTLPLAAVEKALIDEGLSMKDTFDNEALRRLARRLGAGWVASGNYTDLIKNVDVHARLIEVTSGTVMGAATARVQVDGMTRLLLERRGPVVFKSAATGPTDWDRLEAARADLLFENTATMPDGTLAPSAGSGIKAYYLGGQLRLVSPSDDPTRPTRFYLSTGPAVADFIWETTFQKTGGLDGRLFGIYFRLDKDTQTYYFAGVSALGEFEVAKGESAAYTALARGIKRDLLKEGKPNRMAVWAAGRTIKFFVNNVMVASVEDSGPWIGTAGFALDGGLQVSFDDIRVYAVKP